jgi:hypothetical protein
MVAKRAGIRIVHHGEVINVRQEHQRLHHVAESGPVGFEERGHVLQGLRHLSCDSIDELTIRQAELPGTDEKLAGSDNRGVRTDRC